MKTLKPMDISACSRVKKAVEQAMKIYLNQLNSGLLTIGLENAFQFHIAENVSNILKINRYKADEIFTIDLEQNLPINGNKDYVDIVINYHRNEEDLKFLLELKFKKKSDSAPDLGNIESYKDIYNLDSHKATKKVDNCFFIFLTDLETYIKESKRGTRLELPMYDGCTIKRKIYYNVTGKSAKKNTQKYPKGFVFNYNHKIEYTRFEINSKPYWYFILEI